jgi:glycyl-tRNA synthetase
MLGSLTIPFEFAGLTASNVTHGLRFIELQSLKINHPREYTQLLEKQGIILDPKLRKEEIRKQVLKLAVEVGGTSQIDETLLEEVNHLVEAPTALRGTFDAEHLRLPPEVLVSVMKKHQRYFPVQSVEGKLLPYFIAVRNGDSHGLETVIDGNEQVIRARFADANFFINEDLKHKLPDLLEKLGTLTFQHKLGSMLDKSRRIVELVKVLGPQFQLTPDEQIITNRTAELCKADLVSHMVIEMTSLQGVMGRYYARYSGEADEVAQAIYDHYLPRFMGDAVPSNKVGFVVGLADRLDSLAGLFAAGLAPTGTKDPFAQRRTALGLVQCLITFDLDFDIKEGLRLAAKHLPVPLGENELRSCFDFIVGRLRNSLTDQGYRYDVVEAVLAEQQANPAGVIRAVRSLAEYVSKPDWSTTLAAFSRCVRITRDQKSIFSINTNFFADPAETELYKEIERVESSLKTSRSMQGFLTAFLPMIPAVNKFFDAVLVMADDKNVRENRLGMLERVSNLTKGIVDFSALEGF